MNDLTQRIYRSFIFYKFRIFLKENKKFVKISVNDGDYIEQIRKGDNLIFIGKYGIF